MQPMCHQPMMAENVCINPPSGVVHWPTMSLPLPPPPPLQPAQPVAYIASHVHLFNFQKILKPYALSHNQVKENGLPFVSDLIRLRYLLTPSIPFLSNLEDDVRHITFDDMHPKCQRLKRRNMVIQI
jgi:hypothetical protein